MFGEATMEETQQALSNATVAQEDARLIVQFTQEPWHNKEKSAKEGRPIYDLRDYVMIMVPGDKDSIIHRPASQQDIDRFPVQFSRYKNKQEQRYGSGTPLKAVTFLNSAQAKELEYFNVFTVEQLAGMSDGNAQKFMGFQILRQAAQDFLAAAREAAPMTAMRAEMQTKDAQLEAQALAIADLQKRLQQLEKEKAPAEA